MIEAVEEPTLELLTASRCAIDGEVLWTSQPYLIGKTYWVVILYYSERFSEVLTGYHYRDKNFKPHIPYSEWAKEESHPRYNSHDGTYMGLPKGLVKLYQKHNYIIDKCARKEKEIVLEELSKYEARLF